MSLTKLSVISILIVTASIFISRVEEDKTLILRIGNRDLKDKTMDVSLGEIYSARQGRPISFYKMINEMKESSFIYIGETHNSLPMHDIQLKIIQALYEQDKNLSIGLEMFPVSFQEALNKWSIGILTRNEFIRESQWYVNWNYNFGFYEEIFRFVKNNKIPLYALNVPRAIISKIRMKGWDTLSEEEKKLVPKPDLSHEEHKVLIRTIFESTEIPHQMKGRSLDMAFKGLYRAQSAWDEVMAYNAIRAQEIEDKKVVVLAGSGHLLYNLGINRRAFVRSHLPYKTVICVEIPEGRKSIKVSRSLGDYIWGFAEEKIPAFPSLGLRLKKFEGLNNLVIESRPINGISKNADFESGDVILSVDGKSFSEINELRIYLAQFKWNDEVKFSILRNAQQVGVLLRFQPSKKKNE